MKCTSCQFEIDEAAGFAFCPKCGAQISAPQQSPTPAADTPDIAVKAASINTDQKKLLIIEDDLFIRELYQKHLEMAGYTVDTAVDGQEGKEKIFANPYDMILLDIMLPRMNGLDVLKQVKEDSTHKDVPVIILSNLGQDSVVSRGLALGAISYIIKSDITPAEMVKLIQEQIGK
jgi:CheY-like chemotaxis protein